MEKEKRLNWSKIISDNLENFACCDLGAFYKSRLNKITGIKSIVIMDDRRPDFILEYKKFKPQKNSGLNKHGPLKELSTHKDLKDLIKEIHNQDIKVYFGFWGVMTDGKHKFSKWTSAHLELLTDYKEIIQKNSGIQPINPLKKLKKEKLFFAEHICHQYQKIQRDFNFDGLFLGDELNGYRIFSDPYYTENWEDTIPLWTNFYKTLADCVHETGGKLLSYACLGMSPQNACLHGVNYKKEALAGLDYLILETYPFAWGQYWLKDFDGFDFESTLKNLKAVKKEISKTPCKLFYTLELNDNIENWFAPIESLERQIKECQNLADGKLLVWANDILSKNIYEK